MIKSYTLCLLISLLSAQAGCDGGDPEPAPVEQTGSTRSQVTSEPRVESSGATDRVVLVYDPTVLTGADSAVLEDDLLATLRTGVSALPQDTWLDLYVVGEDRIEGKPELQEAMPFDPRRGHPKLHQRRADSLAERVTELARSRWVAAHQGAERPASCILTTMRRSRPSLRRASDPKATRERVALVIVSDLMEACDDFGRLNFERSVPARLGQLADSVDLSDVAAVHLVKVGHPALNTVAKAASVDSVWVDLLQRWGVDRNRIQIGSELPSRLFQ